MKNIHRLMLSLCLATTVSTAYSNAADANAVAKALTSHIKESTEHHYKLLQKELKSQRKEEQALDKQDLKASQKQLQDECNNKKHALQNACNEKKRELYTQFTRSHSTENAEQAAASKSLKAARKAALFLARTLQAAFEYAQEYLEMLILQSSQTRSKELTTALREEKEWLDNLENTTRKSGISFNEPLAKQPKPTKEIKRSGAGRKKNHTDK